MVAIDEYGRPVEPQLPAGPVPPSQWNTKFKMGEDKVEHGLAGLSGTAALYFVGLPLWAAVTIMIGLMFGKEVWDSFGNGYPDWWDFICGVMGILLCVLVYCCYKYLLPNGSSK